jgi:acyl-coenzyme A thioesterase PaaI-like protein
VTAPAPDEAALEAAGWRRLPTRAFSAALGPTWVRGEPGAREVALVTGEAHANDHMGMVHGGVLMTFADIALGVAAADALEQPMMATAQLQFHFTAAAPMGVLLTARPELVRKTSQLLFVRSLFEAGGKTVGMADAMFKVLAPEKMDAISAKSREHIPDLPDFRP